MSNMADSQNTDLKTVFEVNFRAGLFGLKAGFFEPNNFNKTD